MQAPQHESDFYCCCCCWCCLPSLQTMKLETRDGEKTVNGRVPARECNERMQKSGQCRTYLAICIASDGNSSMKTFLCCNHRTQVLLWITK